ncbi:unnamed protein product [Sordaria macrospora k-hell]|uniref:WGS project CABT00000000 data, contig 2.13 n=1 Tax=Sordaria macrospora (strain ATCC MYA-333 / DSM 997 / K(L3346) / K-hell) TaxID=771870 RepID=F7VY44_SORMK|nr:uncharacterized protein SMAC_07990 [Sordaria macrospora k-hell]CCC10438.1 unnamed protein product [Sordaria macrospora k-hell]
MSHPPPPPTTLSTSTSPALIAARGTPSSSTLTTPPSPTTTCNHEAMVVDLPQIEGLPMSRSVWAMPRWDESLAGMTACCNLKPDNEVRMGGPDGCALWCLIPDVFLFEQKEKLRRTGDDDDDERQEVGSRRGVVGYEAVCEG